MKYKIVRRGGRKCLVIRFWDPHAQSWIERSSGVTRRREAERLAFSIIETAMAERQAESTCLPEDWVQFRLKYEREKGGQLAQLNVWKSAVNLLESLENPLHVGDVSPAMLSSYEAKLRDRNLRPATIRSYLKHIRASLRWAERLELIDKAPTISLPIVREGKQMKGRPITTEEYERMLEKVDSVLAEKHATEFYRLIEGIWLTGLRLEEAVDLWWDEPSKIHITGIDCRRPMLVFPAEEHKRREDVIVPLTPDAVVFFRRTPPELRNGRVFNLYGPKKPIRSADRAGRIISIIGEKAGIIVESHRGRDGKLVVKYASAQDLRRAFGERWALRVMPPVLQELMRHRSIETTMKYYVGRNAIRTANEVWRAFAASEEQARLPQEGAALGDTDDLPLSAPKR